VVAKADEATTAAALSELTIEQKATRAELTTKADAAGVAEKQDAMQQSSAKELLALRDSAGTLSIQITQLEEQLALVAHNCSSKGEQREVNDLRQMNEAVSAQVTSLRSELQGTLKSLETWIMQQNTKKGNGVKLQPQPPASYQLAGRIDASGMHSIGAPQDTATGFGSAAMMAAAFTMGGGGGGPALSPRASRAKQPGGAHAMTASTAANQNARVHSNNPALPDGSEADDAFYSNGPPQPPQPPFKSQSDRRQWLLSEKRRWLVEMRLGNTPAEPVAKLPPIASPSPATLSSGMNVDTLVTPR